MGFEFWSVVDYARGLERGVEDAFRYRMMIHDLPRYYHSASSDVRKWMLAEPPPLTERKWDALLAAVSEHLAIVHGEDVPEWVNEEERFLDIPWRVLGEGENPFLWITGSPGAFHRHGVLVNGKDLDERGGHRWYAAILSR